LRQALRRGMRERHVVRVCVALRPFAVVKVKVVVQRGVQAGGVLARKGGRWCNGIGRGVAA